MRDDKSNRFATPSKNQRSGGAASTSLERATLFNTQNVDEKVEKKGKLSKNCWICIGLSIFVLLALAGVVAYVNGGKTSSQKLEHNPTLREIIDYSREVETCITQSCQDAVQEIVSSLNTSVDPCDNFYEFACQGWQQNNPRPAYAPEWSVFGKVSEKTNQAVIDMLMDMSGDKKYPDGVQQAKDFYQSCMDDSDKDSYHPAAYQTIIDTLNEFGGWPLMSKPGHWNEYRFDLTTVLVALKQRFLSPAFIDVMSHQSATGRTELNSIWITKPSASGSQLGTDDETDNEDSAKAQATNNIIGLKDFIVNVSRTLMEYQGVRRINETYLEEKAWEILAVTVEFGKVSKKTANLLFKLVHQITGDLEISMARPLQNVLDAYTYPHSNSLRIRPLLNMLYQPAIPYGKPFDVNSEVLVVVDMDYLLSVSKFLTEIRTEALANFLMFQMVLNMVPFSNSPLEKLHDQLKNTVRGTDTQLPRQEMCITLTQRKFQGALGHLYVENTPFNHFGEVFTMFKGLKGAFTNLISDSSLWYLNKTLLLQETDDTYMCAGYPPWIRRESEIIKKHSGLSIKKNPFLEKLISVNKWRTNNQLSTLREKPKQCDKWERYAGTVGAFSEPIRNLIFMPLGVLQPPFFDVGLPRAINYGSAGSVLGHEISHVFGSAWIQMDGGALTSSAICLVKQYQNFTTDWLHRNNITLNGVTTLQENLPDNLGLAAAYKAYQTNVKEEGKMVKDKPKELEPYTDDQLFFLGFAQNWCHSTTTEYLRKKVELDRHAPGMFRVLGTLQNSEEFADAWKCPVGSNMNPKPNQRHKCKLF